MLCFDDSGLARLVISASRVPYEARGAWLENLAARLEGQVPCSPATLRTRRRRDRQRRGVDLYVIECETFALSDWLVARGFLQQWSAEDRGEIRKALQEFIKQSTRYG